MNPFFESIVGAAKNHEFQHVFLNEKRLKSLASCWAREHSFKIPDWRTPVHWPFDGDDFIQFLGISTAINCCYLYPGSEEKFSVAWHGQNWFGSFAMSACIMRALEEDFERAASPLNPYRLIQASYADMDYMFRGSIKIPLLKRRFAIFREVGRTLIKKYRGHFANLFEAANYRCFDHGGGICERLVKDFPLAFKDIRELNGQTLPFHKKALLLPLLYYGRARASDGKLKQIEDAESISPVADYEVPKSLWVKGVFSYSSELEEKINKREEIRKGSLMETEMRLATVIYGDRLLSLLNKERKSLGKEKINQPQFDYLLWSAGRDSKTPHHITLCTDY